MTSTMSIKDVRELAHTNPQAALQRCDEVLSRDNLSQAKRQRWQFARDNIAKGNDFTVQQAFARTTAATPAQPKPKALAKTEPVAVADKPKASAERMTLKSTNARIDSLESIMQRTLAIVEALAAK